MPSLAVPVSLSEVLEVQGEPLREDQVWGVLCQSAEAIQDIFIRGEALKDKVPLFIPTPDSLLLCKSGRVQLGVTNKLSPKTQSYCPPESSTRHTLSETGIEKMCVYSLGKTLLMAAGCHPTRQSTSGISSNLNSLLSAMCADDPSRRMGLVHILEACAVHSEQHPGHMTGSGHVIQLYNSVLGDTEEMENVHPNTTHQHQRDYQTRKPRHRPKLRHDYHHGNPSTYLSNGKRKSWSSSISPPRSRSRSRSGSRGRHNHDLSLGRQRRGRHRRQPNGNSSFAGFHSHRNGSYGDEDSSSSYGSGHHAGNRHHSENDIIVNGKPSRHLSDVTPVFKANSSINKPSSNVQKAEENGHSGPLSPSLGEVTYQKYLKLKERQQRLRALRADLEENGAVDEPPLMTYPRPRESTSETRSMNSATSSYAQGSYFPELHATYGSELALQLGPGRDRDSVISSDISASSQDHPLIRSSKESLDPDRGTEDISQPHPVVTIQRSQSPVSTQGQSTTSAATYSEPRDFYGPEFVANSSNPTDIINFPLIGESLKNPSNARSVTVVLLTGQRLGVLCDPSTTSQLLFDCVVSHCSLSEHHYFGISYINDGEHMFIENDTKLHKVAPEGWKGDSKHPHPNITFTVYLRIKFYPESINSLKSMGTKQLLYLQLRHDLLEERLQCPDDAASQLASVALQAEYGDYDREGLGRTYFNPEYYLCAHIIRRVGTGYIRDNLPEHHGTHHGLTERQAKLQFIKIAQKLPEYGIHFYKLFKDKADTSSVAWVGVGCKVLTVAETRGDHRVIVQQYQWSRTHKVSFNKRRFSAQPKPEIGQPKPPKLNFYTNSYRKGRYLLQFVTAQHRFQMMLARQGTARPPQQERMYDRDDMVDRDSGNYDEAELLEVSQEAREETLPRDNLDNIQNESVEFAVANRSSGEPSNPPVVYRNPPLYNYRRNPQFVASNLSPPIVPVNGDIERTNPIENSAMNASPVLHNRTSDDTVHDTPAAVVLGASIHSSDQTIQPTFIDTLSETLEKRFDALPSPEPSERCVFEVTLERETIHGFGITIVGGENTGRLDLGIFIQSVTPGGPAEKDGRIQPGDRLIAINDQSLEGIQHHVAVQLIRNSKDSVKLLVSQAKPLENQLVHDSPHLLTKLENSKNNPKESDRHSDVALPSDTGNANRERIVFLEVNEADDRINRNRSAERDIFSTPHSPNNSADINDYAKQLSNSYRDKSADADCSSDFFQADDSFEYENMYELPNHQSAFHPPSTVNHFPGVHRPPDMRLELGDLESSHVSHHPTLISQSSLEAELHFLGIDPDADDLVESSTDSDFDEVLDAAISLKESPRNVIGGDLSAVAIPTESIEGRTAQITLEKKDQSFGFSIGPGELSDNGDMGLFVTEVTPGGPAAETGMVKKGDRVHQINGIVLSRLSPEEAVRLLSNLPDKCEFVLEHEEGVVETTSVGIQAVQQEPPTKRGDVQFEEESSIYTSLFPGFVNVYKAELIKGGNGLGFSIHLTDKNEDSAGVIRIKKIFPAGAAAASGLILEGDVILQVNDQSLVGKTQSEAVSVLRKSPTEVVLILSRSDSSNLPANISRASDETLDISTLSQALPLPEVTAESSSALSLTLVSQVNPDDMITPLPDGTSTPRITGDKNTPVVLFPDMSITPVPTLSSNGNMLSLPPEGTISPKPSSSPSPTEGSSLSNLPHNEPSTGRLSPAGRKCSSTSSSQDNSVQGVSTNLTQTPLEGGEVTEDELTDVWTGDEDTPDSSRSEIHRINSGVYLTNNSNNTQLDSSLRSQEEAYSDNEQDIKTIGEDSYSLSSEPNSVITFRSRDNGAQLGGPTASEPILTRHSESTQENDINEDDNDGQVIEVRLEKELGGGLGFTLAGGVNTTGFCYIKGIAQDPALSDGRLQPGDKLIMVNGRDMSNSSHFEAVTFLRDTPSVVHLVVKREKVDKSSKSPSQKQYWSENSSLPDTNESTSESEQSDNLIDNPDKSVADIIQTFQSSNILIKPKEYKKPSENHLKLSEDQVQSESEESRSSSPVSHDGRVIRVNLEKPETGGIGFSLVTMETLNYISVYVKSITAASVSDGKLCAGDKLLQVNGESVVGMNQGKVAALLRKVPPGSITLTVSRSSHPHQDTAGLRENLKNATNPVSPEQLSKQPPVKPPRKNLTAKPGQTMKTAELSMWDTDLSDLWVESLPLLVPPGKGLYHGEELADVIEELESKIELDEVQHEYKELKHVKATDDCCVARKPENKSKNRYRNVLPYDSNRIKLDDNEEFYINASDIYVTVGNTDFNYIASQGPLANTTDDFWEMVWQHNVKVIAMVTLDMEAEKVKCHKYWPDSAEKSLHVNNRYQICLRSEEKLRDFIVRKLIVDDLVSHESRHVYHLNYTSWPDHGVPESATPLLQFIRVMECVADDSPVLVHCSAGIGRTGALITTHVALNHIKQNLQFSIRDIVSELRKQRQGMIQTKDQYTFCFQAIVQAFQTLT